MKPVDIAAQAIRVVLPDLSPEQATIAATAALKSLRTPTRPMLQAAAKIMTYTHRPELRYFSHREKHLLRWQAMIDAALGQDIPNMRDAP